MQPIKLKISIRNICCKQGFTFKVVAELHNRITVANPEVLTITNQNIEVNDEKYLNVPINGSIKYCFEIEQKIVIKLTNEKLDIVHAVVLGNLLMPNNQEMIFNTKDLGDVIVEGKQEDTDLTQIELNVSLSHLKAVSKVLFYVISHTHDTKPIRVFKSEEAYPNESNDWIFSKVSFPKDYLVLFRESQPFFVQVFQQNYDDCIEIYKSSLTLEIISNTFKVVIDNIYVKAELIIKSREYTLYNFVDYIEKGLKLNLIVAIDYTGSNGHPLDPTSLHYLNSAIETQYENAIKSCGQVLEAYDDDKKIPLYGFGGVPPSKVSVEHFFPIAPILIIERNKKKAKKKEMIEQEKNKFTFEKAVKSEHPSKVNSIIDQSDFQSNDDSYHYDLGPNKPPSFLDPFLEDYLDGLKEIIEAYRASLLNVVFSGPTNFSQVVENISAKIKLIRRNTKELNYFLILIITDGQINDMKQTITSVVNASELPLSIVIVGVGDDDFSSMEELDGDDFPLTNYNNKMTSRDIVQFVPYSKYSNDRVLLGQEILKEIPQQVESYYHFNGFDLSRFNFV